MGDPDDELRSAIEMAEYVASPETDVQYISPLNRDDSRTELISLIEEYGDDTDDDTYRIADVGCGDGTFTRAVSDTCPDATVVGIDLSVTYALLNTANDDGTIVMGGDAYDILPELDRFDFVYAINTVQVMDDPGDALRLIRDALSAEGYAAITVPSPQSGELFQHIDPDDASGIRNGIDDSTGIPYLEVYPRFNGTDHTLRQYLIDDRTMADLLDDAGLSIVDRSELSVSVDDAYAVLDYLDLPHPEEPPEQDPSVNLYVVRRDDT